MRKPISPCMDCKEDREEGMCHTRCEKYKNFKEDVQIYKELINAQKRTQIELDRIEKKRSDRIRKWLK